MNEERIAELEGALTANDEYLQEVEGLNAELLAALWAVKAEIMEPQVTEATWIKIETVIAKAEARK
jgi:hypothetical protein